MGVHEKDSSIPPQHHLYFLTDLANAGPAALQGQGILGLNTTHLLEAISDAKFGHNCSLFQTGSVIAKLHSVDKHV